MAERNDEHDYIAESFCGKGELLLRHAVPDEHQVESCFHYSLDAARRQGAKSLELRAAMRLSRLWQQQERREEARQLLTEVHGWFTEGFDTPDLKDIEALLKELTQSH
jgi:predicted ATPase